MLIQASLEYVLIIPIILILWQVLDLNGKVIKLDRLGLKLLQINSLTLLKALDKHHQRDYHEEVNETKPDTQR